MNTKKMDAIMIAGAGLLLMMGTGPLVKALASAPPLIKAILHLFYPAGVIFLLIGIVRFIKAN